jgi:hypothetical protein
LEDVLGSEWDLEGMGWVDGREAGSGGGRSWESARKAWERWETQPNAENGARKTWCKNQARGKDRGKEWAEAQPEDDEDA